MRKVSFLLFARRVAWSALPVVTVLFASALFVGPTRASCDNAAFSAVVSEASRAIHALNEQGRKTLQEKLAFIKAERGWSDEDLAAKAGSLIKDDVTAALDVRNQSLLAQVKTLGGGDMTDERRCQVLTELKTIMGEVVRNTDQKWSHVLVRFEGVLKPAFSTATMGR